MQPSSISKNIFKYMSNQIFHYTRCTMRSGWGACGVHLHVIAPGNTAFFEEISQRWRAVGNTESNLTGPRFESLTSHSRDECVIFYSTNYNVYCRVAIITLLNNS